MMAKKPNMRNLEVLRAAIGSHLADIADALDKKYKLTFIARMPNEHTKTIIVTDDDDLMAVSAELTSSDDLITVKG